MIFDHRYNVHCAPLVPGLFGRARLIPIEQLYLCTVNADYRGIRFLSGLTGAVSRYDY